MRLWAVLAVGLSAIGSGCASVRPSAALVPTGAAAVAPAAPACNLWSFLLPTEQQKQSLRNCICSLPLGQMVNSMLKPVSAISGGLVSGICPGPNQPNPADLAKPADSAEGAAARVKQSEADAKARRDAVRYLATVDCKRFPEAEAALISSMLSDTNECVRLEAAVGLGRGCCCTQATIKALMQCVSGLPGNDPPETSDRVRFAAAMALESCLARCADGSCGDPHRPESPVRPEQPTGPEPAIEPIPAPPAASPAAATAAEPGAPSDALIAEARSLLAQFRLQQGPLAASEMHERLEAPSPHEPFSAPDDARSADQSIRLETDDATRRW